MVIKLFSRSRFFLFKLDSKMGGGRRRSHAKLFLNQPLWRSIVRTAPSKSFEFRREMVRKIKRNSYKNRFSLLFKNCFFFLIPRKNSRFTGSKFAYLEMKLYLTRFCSYSKIYVLSYQRNNHYTAGFAFKFPQHNLPLLSVPGF